jgi:hypothetical protein
MAAGIVDAANEAAPKTLLGVVLEAIRSPLHAALLVMVYFVWWTTHNVDAAQKSMQEQLVKQNQQVQSIVDSQRIMSDSERRKERLMELICRGVNKGIAAEKCDQQ